MVQTWTRDTLIQPGEPGNQEVVAMLHLKEGVGKQAKGVKKHLQEREEQPQKNNQKDVFGNHCLWARFVLVSYCDCR